MFVGHADLDEQGNHAPFTDEHRATRQDEWTTYGVVDLGCWPQRMAARCSSGPRILRKDVIGRCVADRSCVVRLSGAVEPSVSMPRDSKLKLVHEFGYTAPVRRKERVRRDTIPLRGAMAGGASVSLLGRRGS